MWFPEGLENTPFGMWLNASLCTEQRNSLYMDLMNFLSKANGSLENQLWYEVHFKNLFSRKIWLGLIWENILNKNTF